MRRRERARLQEQEQQLIAQLAQVRKQLGSDVKPLPALMPTEPKQEKKGWWEAYERGAAFFIKWLFIIYGVMMAGTLVYAIFSGQWSYFLVAVLPLVVAWAFSSPMTEKDLLWMIWLDGKGRK